MAVVVTGANNNSIANSSRVCVRTSAGIPYVVVWNISSDDIEIYKGNSATPTSFTEQDTADNPATETLGSVSAAIDSTGVIHIVYMSYISKSDDLIYVTYNTATDQWGTPETINADLGAESTSLANLFTSIAIDSNNIPHVAYVGVEANAGTVGYVIRYENRIGGAWIGTGVEVEGQTNNQDCYAPEITIDADNKPCISYLAKGEFDIGTAIGNANDATSFTLFDLETSVGAISIRHRPTIAVDSSGNHHVAYGTFTAPSPVRIRKHNYGNAWTTWQVAETIEAADDSTLMSLAIDGTKRYVFCEETSSNDIKYFTDASGSWVGPTTLETGTFNTVKAKWARYVDYDSTGTDRGGGTGRVEIDYVFTDEAVSPDIWWATISIGGPPTAIEGQPTMTRGSFVPILRGYADRIGKYNFELGDWRWNYGRLART